MDKKKLIKYSRNLLLFIVLIIITFWIIFKDQDGEELLNTILSSNWGYIALGILTMFTFLCMEAVNIR